MDTFELGRQAERVEIPSTPSVMLVDRGIASLEAINQHPCHIGKEYADYKGNTLVEFLFNHVIITFLSTPRLGSRTYTLYSRSINKEQNRIGQMLDSAGVI
jgi:hypothetical protein